MLKRNDLIAYAMNVASYLISKVEGINQIILHGSIARGDFDEESDIDLFIEAGKKAEQKIHQALENYSKTTNYRQWELKGIKNSISVIVGELESNEWRDLKRAMMNTGLLLYGKYKASTEKIQSYTLFSFENIKPEKKRVAVFRKLFGFTRGIKKYQGLAQKIKAMKVGKGALLVPLEHVNELRNYFQKEKIPVGLYDLWSDEKLG